MEDKTQAIDEEEALIERILRWVEKQKQEQRGNTERGDHA